MIVSVNLVSERKQHGYSTALPKGGVVAVKTAQDFPSCLQCWVPPSVVVSCSNILATGEFINGAIG